MLKKIGVSLVVVGALMVGMSVGNTAFVRPVHAGDAGMKSIVNNAIKSEQRRNDSNYWASVRRN